MLKISSLFDLQMQMLKYNYHRPNIALLFKITIYYKMLWKRYVQKAQYVILQHLLHKPGWASCTVAYVALPI